MANKVSMDITGDDEILALLERFPVLVQAEGGPADKAITQASEHVLVRARDLVPNSDNTNSRAKQSKKTRQKWPKKLRDTIRKKIVKYANASVAIVGPKSPEGNMAHFMQENPRRLVLWGKATAVQMFRISRNWITQAFDETKSEQLATIKRVLTEEIDKVVK